MSRLTTCIEDRCLVIHIKKHFTFDLLRTFRTAYEPHLEAVTRIVIDLQDVEYMDSSALGMLMSLYNACMPKQIPITLAHCNETLREILDIAHFEQKFEIT